jgi:16S rRNA (guanine966-N2)-methyltransferase
MRAHGKPAARPVSGSLRIVAGRLRGSRIEVIDSAGLRPTSDRVRETLFNWLMPVIAGARCLDLYAGTGALGIEACSRGAAECVFVERDRELARRLGENLARLKVEGARVVHADAMGWLGSPPAPFDIVFLDPPFDADAWAAVALRLEEGGWLRGDAWVYVESPTTWVPVLPTGWREHRVGQAGNVRLALYRRAGPDPLS